MYCICLPNAPHSITEEEIIKETVFNGHVWSQELPRECGRSAWEGEGCYCPDLSRTSSGGKEKL